MHASAGGRCLTLILFDANVEKCVLIRRAFV